MDSPPDMTVLLSPPRVSPTWASRASNVAGAVVAAIGLAAALGWILGAPRLAGLTSRLQYMHFDVACTAALLGTSLILLNVSSVGRRRRAGRTLAGAALILPALAAVCTACGWQSPLRYAGLQVMAFSPSTGIVMPMPEAFTMGLCAMSVLLLDAVIGRSQSPAQWLALGMVALGLTGILGHILEANPLQPLWQFFMASSQTAAATTILGAGVLLARPTLRPAAVFWNGGTAGVIARRLLLPVIAAPILMAAVALWSVRARLLDGPLAATVFSLAGVLMLAVLTGWCVSVLARIDHRRGRALRNLRRMQQSLMHARNELERRVQERTAELTDTNAELRRRSAQLARLASEVTLAEQRERQRLAHVLHDHLQQLLVSAKLGLELHSRKDGQSLPPDLRRVQELLSESITSSRELTMELFPPVLHEKGLAEALNWLTAWMQDKHALSIDLQTDPEAVPATQDLAILLFQSARELLFNIVKHANVKAAQVRLCRRGSANLVLTVSDQGTGFEPDMLYSGSGRAGFGLLSVRERLELLGGAMKVESSPGCGSRVSLSAPSDQPATGSSLDPGAGIAATPQ
ncbi:MAG: sensor histidine kinase [Planctomycetaceae bacterium]|nr:sensor histidine kinase [Planctomycetaceae bacterium]